MLCGEEEGGGGHIPCKEVRGGIPYKEMRVNIPCKVVRRGTRIPYKEVG